MVKVRQTEDKELLDEILRQLKDNDHFCPCSLTRTQNDKCMCEQFRTVINSGEIGTHECVCGRYIVTITED
jgi:hypothetical protein